MAHFDALAFGREPETPSAGQSFAPCFGGWPTRPRGGARCVVAALDLEAGEAIAERAAAFGFEVEIALDRASAEALRDWGDCALWDARSNGLAVAEVGRALRGSGAPTLAIVEDDLAEAEALAGEVGDIAPFAADPPDLGADRRLALLSELARLRREVMSRRPLLARFAEREDVPAGGGAPRGPSALFWGGAAGRAALIDALGDGAIAAHADDEASARAAFERGPIDVIFAAPETRAAFGESGGDGSAETSHAELDPLRAAARAIDARALPPIIAVGGSGGPLAADALDPASPPWLLRLRIAAWLERARHARELAAPLDLRRPSLAIDGLSGLFDAGFAHAYLDERRRRRGAPTTVIYLECRCLDAINAAAGFAEGNRLLRTVGEAIRAVIRAEDAPARLAGGKFAILLGAGGAAEPVIERLRAELARRRAIAASTLIAAWAETSPSDAPAETFRALRARIRGA